MFLWYNVSMKNQINYRPYSKIYQPKLFNMIHYNISNDDPVIELKNILEEAELKSFYNTFKHKRKVHPLKMLAIIIYAFSNKISSTREIETLCKENIKYMYLLDDCKAPDHSTISRFMVECTPSIQDVFNEISHIIMTKNNITSENVYIDGTKIEAYANKYTFVWKKAVLKNYEKLLEKINDLMFQANVYYSKDFKSLQEIIQFLKLKKINFVHGKGKKKSKEQKFLEIAQEYIDKLSEYEKHIDICENRNSYSKTDKDATFMRMKEDYMRNGQLKPGYNLQIATCSELIVGYQIFSNPTDVKTLVPFLNHLNSYNVNLKNIIADAGYESLENYEYIDKNGYIPYIKPQQYEKSKTRKFQKDLNRVENLIYDAESKTLKRKDGLELKYIGQSVKDGISYMIYYNEETEKNVWYNYKFREYSKESRNNICSELGKQLRMNRSIQVEGSFGLIKETLKFRKLKIRGKENVQREIGFLLMGYNFRMHLQKRKNKKVGNILHDQKKEA